jgi:segregation and condensation protein B
MDEKRTEYTIEAILFAAGEPVPAARLAQALGVSEDEVIEASRRLAQQYRDSSRGIRLAQMEDKLQLVSAPEYSDEVLHTLERRRPPKLSKTSLEVLAICAYFQPLTRAYVEAVRGVDSSYTMSLLQQQGFIERCGNLEAPGRPVLYRTTELFMRMMGITGLSELPKLPDLSDSQGAEKLGGLIETLKTAETMQLTIEEK